MEGAAAVDIETIGDEMGEEEGTAVWEVEGVEGGTEEEGGMGVVGEIGGILGIFKNVMPMSNYN